MNIEFPLPSTSRYFPDFIRFSSPITELAASLLLHGMVLRSIPSSRLFVVVRILGFSTATTIGRRLLLNKSAEEEKHIARASLVNLVGSARPNIWIHELGHWMAATFCYKNASASISTSYFQSGQTSYMISDGLTYIGQRLGEFNSQMLVDAAGIASSTACALTEFAVSFRLRKTHPNVSLLLIYHGFSQIFNELAYGLSYLSVNKNDLRHDFIKLWRVWDIHPWIPISLMIALPVLELSLLTYLHYRKKSDPV